MMMRVLLVTASLCVAVLACRNIQPLAVTSAIHGYELDGMVTSASGLPLQGVEVHLYYNYDFVSDTPFDTVPVIVHDSTQMVSIAVYTISQRLVKQLFSSSRATGDVPRVFWDGTDAGNLPVPSGLYFIRYTVGATVVKNSRVLVEGHTTPVTDAFGKFKIYTENLPIDSTADVYTADSLYEYTVRVRSDIDIVFRSSSQHMEIPSFQLNKNTITTGAFVL